MSAPALTRAKLTVSHDDLAAILTEHFCGSYGAFKNLQVTGVDQQTDEFDLTLEVLEIVGVHTSDSVQ